jgi:hypothetical protein
VERSIVDNPYTRIFVNYAAGYKGVADSDFDYQRLQLYFKQPLLIGPSVARISSSSSGKTYGTVPLGLMSIVPETKLILPLRIPLATSISTNSSPMSTPLSSGNIFRGNFARVPLLRKLNWREIVS